MTDLSSNDDPPLVRVSGATTYPSEPGRYELRLEVDETVDLLDLQFRLTASVRELDAELRVEREPGREDRRDRDLE